jgi:hypothetical protein
MNGEVVVEAFVLFILAFVLLKVLNLNTSSNS